MATPITKPQEKAEIVLSTYGNQVEVVSLAMRIKVMIPGGNKLTDAEAQALAQVSLITNCNPFIGEVWYIPGIGPFIGIKGARRHGNETIERAGGAQAYWTADLEPCSGEEAGYKGDPKDLAAAYRCTITDSVSSAAFQKMFIETVNTLRAAGSKDPVNDAREICGKRPKWIGYGHSLVSEKSRMNKQALAMKRAEADGIKRKFDIPFGVNVAAGDNAVDAGDWINAQVKEIESGTSPSLANLEPMNIDEARRTVGFINGKEKQLGNCSIEELNHVYLTTMKNQVAEAARIILKEDFRMEPPEQEKKSTDQLQKDLGF